MGFMNSMKSTLNEDFNESYTENGALGYRTTGKYLLDLNFKVASLRKADAETIISRFDKAFSEDHIHALKWLFYLRDGKKWAIDTLEEVRNTSEFPPTVDFYYCHNLCKFRNSYCEYKNY